MAITLEQFGQRIKEKYPEYQNIDDKELGKKVLDKYPVYKSQVQVGIPGVKGVVKGAEKGVISTLSNTGNLIRKGLQAILPKSIEEKAGLTDEGIAGRAVEDTQKQTRPEGTAEKIGFFLEQLAELSVPATKAAKVTKGAGLLTKIGAEAAATGSVLTAQEGDINKDVAVGTALSVAFPIGGKITGAAAKSLTEALPKRLIRSTVGQSKKALQAGKDVSEFVIENKRIGTANQLISKSSSEIEKLNTLITKNIGSVKDTIDRDAILKKLVKEINDGGGAIDENEILTTIEKLAPQAKGLLNKNIYSLPEANKLRQALDRTLGDRAFLTSQLPFSKELMKTFTGNLRELVKQKAPEGTREAFEQLSKEITLRDALLSKYSGKSTNQIISFGDLIGSGIGGVSAGIPGAIAGAAARRVIESPYFKTTSAVSLAQLKKLETSVQAISPEIKSFLIELLSSSDEIGNGR